LTFESTLRFLGYNIVSIALGCRKSLWWTAHSWANWFISDITQFLLFLAILFMVELVSLEWADARVCLMVSLIVRALERVEAQLTLFCFQTRRIYFFVCFTASYKLVVVFCFVRPIALYALGPLNLVQNIECTHLQQFLHWETSEFMLAFQIVTM